MKIVIYAENVPIDFDKAEVILNISEDKKSFDIEKHCLAPNFRSFPTYLHYGKNRSISELKHILLAGIK